MLCSLLPVKYWSAAPKESSSTTRRSTWMPLSVMTDDLVAPCASTRMTWGILTKSSITFSGSFEVVRISTSLTVSFQRRMLPATAIRPTGAPSFSRRIMSFCKRNDPADQMPACAPVELLDAFEDVLFRFFLDPAHPRKPAGAGHGFQFIDAPDVCLFIQHFRRLRADARNPGHLQHAGRNLLDHLFMCRNLAGFAVFLDLARKVLADSRESAAAPPRSRPPHPLKTRRCSGLPGGMPGYGRCSRPSVPGAGPVR